MNLTDAFNNQSTSRVHKIMAKRLTKFALAVLLAAISAPLVAAEFQSLQSIRMHAEDYIQQYPYETPYSPRIQISNLDPRLRLKACQQALKMSFARTDKTHGNTALNVSCEGKNRWKLLLPAQIELYDDVLVLTKAVQKGQIIDRNLVRLQKKNISRLNNGYFSQISDITGLESRRNLSRGTILTPTGLVPKLLVKSGQRVTLILNYRGLQVQSNGIALQSARRGEVIRVRNSHSSKIVEGIVSGEAQVRVNI